MTDKNNLAYWYPVIKRAGLPVPETEIVTTECDLSVLLDGEMPEGWRRFLFQLSGAAARIGYPCFLRTGHGSGKHDWEQTCYVTDPMDLASHVGQLVEWSHTVDFLGLPTNTWVVRRLIPTTPLFHAFSGRMPITREFRFFVRDINVEHVQPYWPKGALEGQVHDHGHLNDSPSWRLKLAAAGLLSQGDFHTLRDWTERAGRALGGYWSVDWIQDVYGGWWLTDMALGDDSFRYDPKTGASNQESSFVTPDYRQILERAGDE